MERTIFCAHAQCRLPHEGLWCVAALLVRSWQVNAPRSGARNATPLVRCCVSPYRETHQRAGVIQGHTLSLILRPVAIGALRTSRRMWLERDGVGPRCFETCLGRGVGEQQPLNLGGNLLGVSVQTG